MPNLDAASENRMTSKKQTLEVEGRRITVSNLDKVFYPGHRFTKAQVIDYYVRISELLLPHLENRPVTLKRFPNGVFGEFFYEKDAPAFTPDWVKTFPVARREKNGPDIRYIVINDLPTLVWLASLANLEIHPFLYRAPDIDRPTWIVFDLDPGKGADILTCGRVALMLRETLAQLRLESSIKVSGSKGLQVYVPLNTRATFEQTQPFAKAIAELLAQQSPDLIVSEMPKVFRSGKVFIDWSQNADFKSTVSVYSLRAKTYKPFVSVPIEWKELERALAQKDADALFFSPAQALSRAEKRGDLFKDVLTKKQKLPLQLTLQLRKSRPRTRTRPAGKSSRVRGSRQGGRKRFVAERTSGQTILRLEMNNRLRNWIIQKSLPSKPHRAITASSAEDTSVEYLTSSAVAGAWDFGTYELIDGSYHTGSISVHLSGQKLKGEFVMERAAGGKHWKLTKG